MPALANASPIAHGDSGARCWTTRQLVMASRHGAVGESGPHAHSFRKSRRAGANDRAEKDTPAALTFP